MAARKRGAPAEARSEGRPTLLTPEVAEKILQGVRFGAPIEACAEYAGVSRHTVLEWVRRGEERDDERPANPLLVEFANRYRQARAAFLFRLLKPCNEVIDGVRPSKKKGPDGKSLKMVKSLGAPISALEAHWHLGRRFAEFYGSGLEQYTAIAAAAALSEQASAGPPKITIVYGPDPDDEPDPDGTT